MAVFLHPFQCISGSSDTVFFLFRNCCHRPGLFPVRTRRCFFYNFTLPCFRQRIPVLSQIRGAAYGAHRRRPESCFPQWFLSHLPSYAPLPPPVSLYLYRSICRYVLPEGRFRSSEVHVLFPGGLPCLYRVLSGLLSFSAPMAPLLLHVFLTRIRNMPVPNVLPLL